MDPQTRQLAAVSAPATGTTLAHLVSYLNARGDDMPVDEALAMAIDAWLAADQRRLAGGAVIGYQWKCLFLPDGTHVRMRCKALTYYAVVEGDALLYEGRSVSPRGMTLAIAGEGRNAWSALMVRRPGDANWQYASVLRARIERTTRQPQVLVPPLVHAPWRAQPQPQLEAQPQPQPQAITQADSLATAARCMSDALRSAMAVVDHMNAQAAQQQDERRRGRCRRESDRHPDDIAFE